MSSLSHKNSASASKLVLPFCPSFATRFTYIRNNNTKLYASFLTILSGFITLTRLNLLIFNFDLLTNISPSLLLCFKWITNLSGCLQKVSIEYARWYFQILRFKCYNCRFSYARAWELVNLFVKIKIFSHHICYENIGRKHSKIFKSQGTGRKWKDRSEQYASKEEYIKWNK